MVRLRPRPSMITPSAIGRRTAVRMLDSTAGPSYRAIAAAARTLASLVLTMSGRAGGHDRLDDPRDDRLVAQDAAVPQAVGHHHLRVRPGLSVARRLAGPDLL